MSRQITEYVHLHREITISDEGDTFMSENMTMMRLSEGITMDEFKDCLRVQYSLLYNQAVSKVWYRCPVKLSPFLYRKVKMENDYQLQVAVITHLDHFQDQAMMELLVELSTVEINLSTTISTYMTNPDLLSQVQQGLDYQLCDPTTLSIPQYYSQPSSSDQPLLLSAAYDMGLEDNISDELNDPDYDPKNFDNHSDDEDDDTADVITTSDMALMTDTSSTFLHYVDVDRMGNDDTWHTNALAPINIQQELCKDMRFADVLSLRRAVKLYAVRTHQTFRLTLSKCGTEDYRCPNYGNGCEWRVRAVKKSPAYPYRITKYNGDHTCLSAIMSQDHEKLDSDLIVSCITPLVSEKGDLAISQIITIIRNTFGYTLSYKKAWLAKHKALSSVFGGWKRSYNLLPWWLNAVRHFNPGTVYELDTHLPTRKQNGKVYFRRLFWTFKPCIDAFVHLKPILQMDATHLYGKYTGQLIMVVSQDGDRKIVPIAFALVEGETKEAYQFFLSHLKTHVTKNRPDLCIITDRGKGASAALEDAETGWKPPYAHWKFCIRHLGDNVKKETHNKYLREKFINIGYYFERHRVDAKLAAIRTWCDTGADYIADIPLEQWSRAYDTEGLRWGQMTTNLVECMNGIFLRMRHLPVLGLVKATLYKLVEYFTTRATTIQAQISAQNTDFSKIVMKDLQINRERARRCVVIDFNPQRSLFEVEEPLDELNGQFRRTCKLDLSIGKCDCGEFQTLHFPCQHAIAACLKWGFDYNRLVNNIFRLETILKAYQGKFYPIGSQEDWPVYNGQKVLPHPQMTRKQGRPKSTRTNSSMDYRQRGEPSRCGICRQTEHNRSTCPSRPVLLDQSD